MDLKGESINFKGDSISSKGDSISLKGDSISSKKGLMTLSVKLRTDLRIWKQIFGV